MKLSDYVVNFIIEAGTSHVFELAGGAITHLTDSMGKNIKIKTVSMHHEQAAAFSAEGYARTSGKTGVAMATSGPGATNLITGIASCYFDSVPCVFITGQVNTYEFKNENSVRQLGFQETDIVKIVKPIVKESVMVKSAKNIRYYMERAFYIANEGRKGPVLIDLPMNVQRAEINPEKLKGFRPRIKNLSIMIEKIERDMQALIAKSERPLFLIGGGVRSSGVSEKLRQLIEISGIPVVCTLLGLDSFRHDSLLFNGMIGTYGNRNANIAMAKADLIIAIGARFDSRQIGTNPTLFFGKTKIIRVDIDKTEINNKFKADVKVNMDVREFIPLLKKVFETTGFKDLSKWKGNLKTLKELIGVEYGLGNKGIIPNEFLVEMSKYMPRKSVVCTDIGQNQMWAAQSVFLKRGQRFLTQGGMGAMGSSLPLAIGAVFSQKGILAVSISGDGGFQLNIQELQTVLHHNLPVKMIVINNGCYGMVRQFQQQYFNSNYYSTKIGYSSPDFIKVADAYGIKAVKLSKKKDVKSKLKWFFGGNGPKLLEVIVEQNCPVIPKLSVNKPIDMQEPHLADDLNNKIDNLFYEKRR